MYPNQNFGSGSGFSIQIIGCGYFLTPLVSSNVFGKLTMLNVALHIFSPNMPFRNFIFGNYWYTFMWIYINQST